MGWIAGLEGGGMCKRRTCSEMTIPEISEIQVVGTAYMTNWNQQTLESCILKT